MLNCPLENSPDLFFFVLGGRGSSCSDPLFMADRVQKFKAVVMTEEVLLKTLSSFLKKGEAICRYEAGHFPMHTGFNSFLRSKRENGGQT